MSGTVLLLYYVTIHLICISIYHIYIYQYNIWSFVSFDLLYVISIGLHAYGFVHAVSPSPPFRSMPCREPSRSDVDACMHLQFCMPAGSHLSRKKRIIHTRTTTLFLFPKKCAVCILQYKRKGQWRSSRKPDAVRVERVAAALAASLRSRAVSLYRYLYPAVSTGRRVERPVSHATRHTPRQPAARWKRGLGVAAAAHRNKKSLWCAASPE